MGKVMWSELPEELVDSIADRMSANTDLICIRSICKPWRSAVASRKRVPDRFKRSLAPFNGLTSILYSTTFFRVTHPSSPRPNKGWLITTKQLSKVSKTSLVSLFSDSLLNPNNHTLNLLDFGVSEILRSYVIRGSYENSSFLSSRFISEGGEYNDFPYLHIPTNTSLNSSRVVLVENLVIAVDSNNQLWWCKSGKKPSEWTRIIGKEVEANFMDIIVHKGQVYVLDRKGAIWWIRLSDLTLVQFTHSTLMDYYYNEIYNCKDMRLVEYCGDLCIVHRLSIMSCLKSGITEKAVRLKVYKMDQELMGWAEFSSLGDKALIIARDSCFTVLASDYCGCLDNAIYFRDDDGHIKVFKLGDNSIITMIGSSQSSCFQMFSPPFL